MLDGPVDATIDIVMSTAHDVLLHYNPVRMGGTFHLQSRMIEEALQWITRGASTPVNTLWSQLVTFAVRHR